MFVLQVFAYFGSSISRHMMNHEDQTQLSAINHTKNQRKNEGKVIGIDAVEDRRQCSEESAIPGISLRLRKFRWDCENIATLAKISQS